MVMGSMDEGPGIGAFEDTLWLTQPEIKGATDELDARIKAFGKETFEQLLDVPDVQGFITQWNAFVADWDAFRDEWWVNPYRRRDGIIAFRARFNALADSWAHLRGAMAPQSVQQYSKDQAQQHSPLPGLGSALGLPSWALPTAAVALGAIVVLNLTGSLRALLPRRAV